MYFWCICVHCLFVLLESFCDWYVIFLWYSNSLESVVNSTTTGTTTWPRTIENQADSLGFRHCILGSTIQGRVGPDVIQLYVTPSFSLGVWVNYFVCVFSLSLRWDIWVLLCLVWVMYFWYYMCILFVCIIRVFLSVAVIQCHLLLCFCFVSYVWLWLSCCCVTGTSPLWMDYRSVIVAVYVLGISLMCHCCGWCGEYCQWVSTCVTLVMLESDVDCGLFIHTVQPWCYGCLTGNWHLMIVIDILYK